MMIAKTRTWITGSTWITALATAAVLLMAPAYADDDSWSDIRASTILLQR